MSEGNLNSFYYVKLNYKYSTRPILYYLSFIGINVMVFGVVICLGPAITTKYQVDHEDHMSQKVSNYKTYKAIEINDRFYD